MDESVEAFMDSWLEANVTKQHTRNPSARTLRVLAKQCVADAAAEGISLENPEKVANDIEDAIADELSFVAAMKAKKIKLG